MTYIETLEKRISVLISEKNTLIDNFKPKHAKVRIDKIEALQFALDEYKKTDKVEKEKYFNAGRVYSNNLNFKTFYSKNK